MKFKKLLVATCFCTTLISPALININKNTADITNNDNNQITTLYNFSNVTKIKSAKEERTFSIRDGSLANKLMTLLGKSENSFSSSDFLNHDDYKVIEEQIGTDLNDEPIYNKYANKEFLDLSYSNVQNLTELSQFVWPETLKSIDLSGNNITNENLSNITNILNINSDSPDIVAGEITYPIYGDFSNIIEIINLNNNKINLSSLSSETLNSGKLIFGLQNLSNGIYYNNDLPGEYYIKTSDIAYLNFSLTVNNESKTLIKDEVTPLKNYGLGDYVFKITSVENANIASINKSFTPSNFNTYIKDSFSVERKSLFNITKNDVVIEGLLEGYTISAGKTTTKDIGEEIVNITITTNTKSWTAPLKFKVVDTVSPTLTLKGGETIYLAVNGSTYVEYGCIGLDSGDNISHNIQISGRVDITTPGEYILTYTLADDYGNEATPITRKVVVQAYSLQKVIINSLNPEFVTNEDITLTANLPNGVDLSKYKKLEYTWYYDDQEFITTPGDNLTGRSSITLLETSAKKIKVYAVLTATLNDDSTESYISQVMELDVKKSSAGLSSITISILLALSIIIIILVVVIIENKKRKTHSKGKSNSKSNSKSKKKKGNKKKESKKSGYDNYDNIQVIKNYEKNNNDDPPSKMQ